MGSFERAPGPTRAGMVVRPYREARGHQRAHRLNSELEPTPPSSVGLSGIALDQPRRARAPFFLRVASSLPGAAQHGRETEGCSVGKTWCTRLAPSPAAHPRWRCAACAFRLFRSRGRDRFWSSGVGRGLGKSEVRGLAQHGGKGRQPRLSYRSPHSGPAGRAWRTVAVPIEAASCLFGASPALSRGRAMKSGSAAVT
jgi:hypothetical protein